MPFAFARDVDNTPQTLVAFLPPLFSNFNTTKPRMSQSSSGFVVRTVAMDGEMPANPLVSPPSKVVHAVHVRLEGGQLVGMPDFGGGAHGGAGAAPAPAPISSPPSGPKPGAGLLGGLFGGSKKGSGGGGGGGGGGADAGDGAVVISGPMNFKHGIHVSLDVTSPSGLRGLPPEWEAMLTAGGISKAEQQEHPQAVMEVLKFQMGGRKPKAMAVPVAAAAAAAASAGSAAGVGPARLHRAASLELTLETARASVFDTATDPATLFELDPGGQLGAGASGVVCAGTDRRSGVRVAIKMAPASEMETLKNEVALQALSKHPSIVSLVGAYHKADQLWIVLELVRGGSLTEVLGPSVAFPEACIAFVTRVLLEGLAFLHAQRRLHRDIKSDNVLVDFDGTVKIADFGFAVGLVRSRRGPQMRSHAPAPSPLLTPRCAPSPHPAHRPRRWTSGRAWWARPFGWRPSSSGGRTMTARWTCGRWASRRSRWRTASRRT